MSSHSAPDPSSFPVYFDAQASQSAQPVVPFETVSSAARPFAPRRSWLVLAVAVSALIGGLTGVAAYSIYQRGATANKTAPAQQQAAPANSTTTAAAATITADDTAPPISLTTQRTTATPTDAGGKQINAASSEVRDVNDAARVTTNESATERTRNADSNANATITSRREVGNDNADAEAARRTSTRTNAAPTTTTPVSVSKDERAKRENEQATNQGTLTKRPDANSNEQNQNAPTKAERARRVARPDEDQTPREAQPGYTERVRDIFENGGRNEAPPRPRPNRRNAERLRQIFEGRDQRP